MERSRVIERNDQADQPDDELPAGGRNQAEQNNNAPQTPQVPQPPRAAQDTQPVDGDDALNLPPEADLIQKPKIQG